MIEPAKIKADSIEFLRSLDVPVNDHLPIIETETELSPQTAADVARRCMVLSHIIGIGFGGDASKLLEAMTKWELLPYASASELDMLSRSNHSEQERINATWMIECLQSFAWCLDLAELNIFKSCDDDLSHKFPAPFRDPSQFIATARLRHFEEIYRQADIHYRLHWAARDAQYKRTEFPVSEGLIRERRKALDWVIGVESDWDEIPADT